MFEAPPAEARPWVFWYWLGGAIGAEGITADLEAMAANGIGGAYLMPLIEPDKVKLVDDPVATMSPGFWDLVRLAASEADRLGVQLGMHSAAGFSLAGGPWITPEKSMQQVVWTTTRVRSDAPRATRLPQPESVADHYRDIAALAFPTPPGEVDPLPAAEIRTDRGDDASRLADPANDEGLRMEEAGWIDFRYPEPVTLRSLRVRPQGNNYQSLRLKVLASDDGETFRPVRELDAPRHGWMSEGIPVSYALPPTTARVFRFRFDPVGSEPGAEDLDWAKWKPVLKLRGLEPSAAARIEGFEGKSARIWRVAPATPDATVAGQAIDPENILDLSDALQADGSLARELPEGDWTVLRIGHTSTGATNYLGAAAMGLEVDKLDADAVALQFDRWFGEARRQIGPELADRVLKVFHSDSWETGSQNWTPGLRREFEVRRGYELTRWLPLLAGYPVAGAADSERVLLDFRETIAELLDEGYFGTIQRLAGELGLSFSAECTAPVMSGDGLRHYDHVDIPMGEFWLDSPTHDKPNDLLDAVSGARIYGKRIVQAEAFTQLRLQWDEHPAMLKALGDRHYALGINRFSYHVFMHTPWADREPGVTLNGVGLVFQRGQTWWKPGKAWNDYHARCQALLQQGRPVVDVAVFTGGEIPRRSLTPDRLAGVLSGLVGSERVRREQARLANDGQPLRERPPGVRASAGITGSDEWTDPLRGYAYDSLNPDVLLRLATVEDGRLVLPGGASYRVLVLPGPRRMDPAARMSDALRERVDRWRDEGLVVIEDRHEAPDFREFGLAPDFLAHEDGQRADAIAWTHRHTAEGELYFVSNQRDQPRELTLSLRGTASTVEIWNAVDGSRRKARETSPSDGRTTLALSLPAHGSAFVVTRPEGREIGAPAAAAAVELVTLQRLEDGGWSAEIPGRDEALDFADGLASWSDHPDEAVRHFSGTARYRITFDWDPQRAAGPVFLDLGRVANLAEVRLNGHPVGTVWTAPWRLEVGGHLVAGPNRLEVDVTNTWRNRLVAEAARPESERGIWTNAPLPAPDRELAPSGLLGPVELLGPSKESASRPR